MIPRADARRTGPPQGRRTLWTALFLAAVLAGLSGCTSGGAGGTETTSASPEKLQTQSPAARAPQAAAMSIPDLVDAVEPSVVTIFTDNGLGSGVIYSGDGLVLTNEHVVRDSTQVEVGFADGQRVAGTVKATDPVSDLALVQADRKDLPAARFEARLPEVGELAVVIGSPLGFENTVTAGIISGLHRQIPGSASTSASLVDLIQTDAAISPGNSGGAVVNGQGKVVGISEAYIPPQSGAVALGFAIPAATATEVAKELLENGKARHSFMGLAPAAITGQIAQRLGLADTEGVLVLSVVEGGPADKAGLRPGDILEKLDGDQLSSPEDLLAALRKRNPGDQVNVEFQRGDRTQTAKVALSDRPAA
ncbi:S1C family serine protease [Arthrobacter sp. GCM10027362]|uniref:S1C family serine protease n=1 Tax=Arthrobacter sp. GCM10027362 TaxID=3273379 RepID=UPI003640C7B5